MRVDLNADVGEWVGETSGTDDAALLPCITSANVACGFHAGDPGAMRATVALALQHGVAVGAHPALADRAGFGRREMPVAPIDVEALVIYQLGALAAIARAQGVRLQHVKPHGALFHMAARDRRIADAVAQATAAVDASLILFGPPGSELIAAGKRAALRTACEVFADRAYRADGTLAPRDTPGAVLTDPEVVVVRAVAMARDHRVAAADGATVALDVDTICVHGDTPGAAELARRIRAALIGAGVTVAAVGAP